MSQDDVDNAKYVMETAEKDVNAVTDKFLIDISSLEIQRDTCLLQLDALTNTSSETELEEKVKVEFFVSINNSIETTILTNE